MKRFACFALALGAFCSDARRTVRAPTEERVGDLDSWTQIKAPRAISFTGYKRKGAVLGVIDNFELSSGHAVNIKLYESPLVISHGYTVAKQNEDGTFEDVSSVKPNTNCLYFGDVFPVHSTIKTGIASIDACNQGVIAGFVIENNTKYELVQGFSPQSSESRRLVGNTTDGNTSKIDETLVFNPKIVIQEQGEEEAQNGVVAASSQAEQAFDLPDTLYIELLLVSDNQHLLQNGNNLGTLKQTAARLLADAAAFYNVPFPDGKKVVLVVKQHLYLNQNALGVQASSGGETDSRTLLDAFNDWRREHLSKLTSHDIAHLVSGRNFDGGTIGLAFVGSACDETTMCATLTHGQCFQSGGCCVRNAGAITQNLATRPAVTAETVAHEIGHQLGFHHDGDRQLTGPGQFDTSRCPQSGFLMAAISNNNQNPDITWSPCTFEEFAQVYNSSPDRFGYHKYGCLANTADSPSTPPSTPSPRPSGEGGNGSATLSVQTFVVSVLLVALSLY
mmetsp:Transcript_8777/g.14220  ORF Transcript_8777/g.14220 Transcript_8777/m.14220 type:complete len:505 (+) Transcript_8777:2764-4278(+)